MRRARVSSKYVGRGRKRGREELDEGVVEIGAPKGRTMVANAPNCCFKLMATGTTRMMIKEEPSDDEDIRRLEAELAAEVNEDTVMAASQEGCAAAVAAEEFDDALMIDWNAWSFEQEERTWWGRCYWDYWIWYPNFDYTVNDEALYWASSFYSNEEVAWELLDLWNWDTN